MALWGKRDDVYSPGTVSVNYTNKVVTGSGTSFNSASVGDVIGIGTFGEAVISKITSQTEVSIASTQFLSGGTISAKQYTISQKPKFAMNDAHWKQSEIYGIDENEVKSTEYGISHAGWVGVTTYLDQHGTLRRKSEVLVAMSGITTGTATYSAGGDAEDDIIAPDTVILITSQPSSVGVGTTGDALFEVTASTSPVTQSISYQWQESTDSGTSYDDLTEGGDYAGVDSDSLLVSNSDDTKDGYLYRVVLTSTGAETVTSESAELSIE